MNEAVRLLISLAANILGSGVALHILYSATNSSELSMQLVFILALWIITSLIPLLWYTRRIFTGTYVYVNVMATIYSIFGTIIGYAMFYRYAGLREDGVFMHHPAASDALYFSIITWTTVGYGDITPANGAARIIAGSEAFSGYIAMGFLVAVILRSLEPLRR